MTQKKSPGIVEVSSLSPGEAAESGARLSSQIDHNLIEAEGNT